MKVHIDSLVRGPAGFAGRTVEGRVFAVRGTYVGIIGKDDGKQWVIYNDNLEVLDKPRPLRERTDIPARLR